MSEEDLKKVLYASFKNRAMMYYHIFEELQKEVGEEKATEIMKRGIYNRGLEIGKPFAKYAPSDMEGLKKAFMAAIPDDGRMFEPEVLRCDPGGIDIRMSLCPLKNAWQEAGLSDEVIEKMCSISRERRYRHVRRGRFPDFGGNLESRTRWLLSNSYQAGQIKNSSPVGRSHKMKFLPTSLPRLRAPLPARRV